MPPEQGTHIKSLKKKYIYIEQAQKKNGWSCLNLVVRCTHLLLFSSLFLFLILILILCFSFRFLGSRAARWDAWHRRHISCDRSATLASPCTLPAWPSRRWLAYPTGPPLRAWPSFAYSSPLWYVLCSSLCHGNASDLMMKIFKFLFTLVPTH